MANYFKYKYEGSEEITVQDFLDNWGKIAGIDSAITVDLSSDEFLAFGEGTGKSNIDFIVNRYNKIYLSKYASEIGSLSSSLLILPGTIIYLPKDNTAIELAVMFSEGQFLKQNNFPYYQGDYPDLLKDLFYLRSEYSYISGSGVDIKLINESFLVWVYVRAIDQLIDITPFIPYCNVSKQSDIGNFSFSLNPSKNIEEVIRLGYNDIVDQFSINDSVGHLTDFFEKYLQSNDVIFIRFEQLERDRRNDTILKNRATQIIEPSYLKMAVTERTWDMIGLVDTPRVTYSASNTDKAISVSGRDLMKLLVEDGSYFIPYKYIEGKDDDSKFVWGGDSNDNWFKRNFISGNLDFFFSYEMKNISASLQFILNHLSNLGIVPNKLFQSYGSDITQIYNIPDDPDGEMKKKAVNGIWQIVKLAVDSNIDDRRIAGEGLINPDGTLYEFFNAICQKPFVEFWGDTFTDTFDLIVRQPPFTKAAIWDVVDRHLYIEIEERDLLNFDIQNEQTFYSSYQIVPQGAWSGYDEATFASIVPIIYMPQYAELFGNKRLVVKDPYLARIAVFGNEKSAKFNNFIESILNDYRLVIESNAYLPFTRRGTITMNGDRRIKKGGFVLNKATNELFYVEGVSNDINVSNRSIDRTTTISVSRGMKLPYIKDNLAGLVLDSRVTVKRVPYTYFDIVDAELIEKNILAKNNISGADGGVKVNNKTSYTTKFGVNEDAFNYFFQRKHFE